MNFFRYIYSITRIVQADIYLITPPFTQLNTPYPATAYLKGFLNTKGITSFQSDLGIEVINTLFSENGLRDLFATIHLGEKNTFSENTRRKLALQEDYIATIDRVILFLQGKEPTLAYQIAAGNFLPEASRFSQPGDLEWAFGTMGVQDKAKHLATLYLEDISDLITECIDPHFGFSRYAERLGRSANTFDELYAALQGSPTCTDKILTDILDNKIRTVQPALLAISVPFPGNLYAAFRCAQHIKRNYPHIKTVMGGGFPNTELRSLQDPRVFEFFDFITLDDGEAPLEKLWSFIQDDADITTLKRTFICRNNTVQYIDNHTCADYNQAACGTPDYSDLYLDKYIAAIEILNPMHSLWSNGRWNKLTMAHGCYWGKCTFCDLSLNYIQLYEPLTAGILCDRMEKIILTTGQTGFHFVDEAAPPGLMRALALEIIKRKMIVTWWTNIRFEKSFTRDLCLLLRASGCIGVSGGLEVASDRLLAIIQKGVTVAQVARVNKNFTDAGIMVHAYLMYGFPTETMQETIDSLEMVRQMFAAGVLQSGFWHRFAMTAHSPVGMHPENFNVRKESAPVITFANNDIEHIDPTGADHALFSEGLKISLFNYMQGVGFDLPLQEWFDFEIPETTIDPGYIENIIEEENNVFPNRTSKIVWLGNTIDLQFITRTKKGVRYEMAELTFYTKTETHSIKVNREQGVWLKEILQKISVYDQTLFTLQEIKDDYNAAGLKDFELFWNNKPVSELWRCGLLHV